MATTTVNDLILAVLQGQHDPAEQIKLINEIRKARPPLADRWLYRWVVWFLGLAVIVTISYGMWLLGPGKVTEIPSGLVAIGSAAVGALAGLISAPSSSSD